MKRELEYGTEGHGLDSMVGMGWWLDLRILDLFSSLNDMILQQVVDFSFHAVIL